MIPPSGKKYVNAHGAKKQTLKKKKGLKKVINVNKAGR